MALDKSIIMVYYYNMKVNIGKVSCKRCGYSWYPRKPEVRVCPKCKSPYFDRDRKEK